MFSRPLALLALAGALLARALPEQLFVQHSVGSHPPADFLDPYAQHLAGEHHEYAAVPGLNDTEKKTIYQALSGDKHFSRLTKAIDFAEDEIVNLLNDTSAGITFFAIPDAALQPPHHKRPHPPHKKRPPPSLHLDAALTPGAHLDLAELLPLVEDLDAAGDDPDKDRRKRILKKIVTHILKYHILPLGLDASTLAQNHTHATALAIRVEGGPLDGQPQRLRVQRLPFKHNLKLNFYSATIRTDVRALNGIIQIINRPLFPPPAVFQELFLFPKAFSFATSALQRVGLTHALDLRWRRHDDKPGLEGTPVVTFFAPTNLAFSKLPRKLQLFLFSPFGERALRKLLQFHVVPNLVVHSDYFYNATEGEASDVFVHAETVDPYAQLMEEMSGISDCWMGRCGQVIVDEELGDLLHEVEEDLGDWASDAFPPPPDYGYPNWAVRSSRVPIYSANLTLPTLLAGHTLSVHVAKFKLKLPVSLPRIPERYWTEVVVNGQRVVVSDVVSQNGAVQVVGRVLNPRGCWHRKPKPPGEPGEPKHPGGPGEPEELEDDGGWEDWEEWLPLWAAE